MLYFGDPLYMLVMIVGMALVFGAQAWVQGTYRKYSAVAASRGMAGAQVARHILDMHGLGDVQVEMVEGFLSDHYDPRHKVVRLSRPIYAEASVAGTAVAAHECGHAIQHAKGYFPVVLRSSLAPVAGLGSSLGPLLIMFGIMLGVSGALAPDLAMNLAWLGVIGYGLAVLFHLVTLPVELDASGRALAVLSSANYLAPDEMPGAKKVLTAAAFTYVAAALYALMELVYWIMRLMGSSRRD